MIVQEIPAWLVKTVVIVCLALFFGLLGGARFLEMQYIGPYTLINTSDREKWRRAAILASLQTAIIPIACLAALILGPSDERWFYIVFCNGVWIVVLPIAILFKRSRFEWQIKLYQSLNRMIKDKSGNSRHTLTAMIWNRYRFEIFITEEQKRFLREGFPDDIEIKLMQM